MPVAGDQTAQWAPAAYTPPFRYGSARTQRPLVTGIASGAAPTATGNPNPVIPPNVPSQAYVWYYLMSHMTSWPTYRYQYLFWFAVAAMAIIYAVSHHLRLSGGSLGAGYTKWGMRRISIGRAYALPSTSTLLVTLIVAALAIVLSIVGNDYIAPAAGTFAFAKRAYIGGPQDSTLLVQLNISKSGWTLGNRFGFMAFAVMPLCVLLAAKSPPFAIFSWKWFTHLYSDKLITFHRAAGWLVWGLTTAHVVFWIIQLFKDIDPNTNRAMFFTAFQVYRFIFGIVAYGLMTLLVILSQRPIRKSGYEFFYHAHVTLTTLTLVACIVHHPAIWWWCAAALVIFLGDRLWRSARWMRINTGAAKSTTVKGGSYSGLATDDIVLEEFTDKMLPPVPAYDHGYDIVSAYSSRRNSQEQPYGTVHGYGGSPEIQPTGTFESRRYEDDEPQQMLAPPGRNASLHTPRSTSAQSFISNRSVSAASNPNRASISTVRARPPVIPPGYAQAQLLPSRTVRLTIRTPRPIKWAPGQNVLVTLPELSKIQAHPFTICNSDPNEMVLLIKSRKGLTRQLYNRVRERSEASMRASDSKAGSTAAPIYMRALVDGPMGSAGRVRWGDFATVLLVCGGTGVSFGLAVLEHMCKAIQRGDFKSKTRRVRFLWVAREYAEIAWAASALCRARAMVPSTAQLQIDIYVTNAAPQGYSSTTYHAGAYGDTDTDFARPRPSFANPSIKRSESTDSMGSAMSADPRMSTSSGPGQGFDYADEEMANAGGRVIDYTNYEDEDDVNDPAESELSRQIQKQGKLRRAKSRKVQARPAQQEAYGGSMLYPPSRPQHSRSGSDSSAGSHLPPGAGYYGDIVAPQPGRRSISSSAYEMGQGLAAEPYTNPKRFSGRSVSSSPGLLAEPVRDPRRMSFKSIASSAYDRYDPYNAPGLTTGISPSPSGFFDDGDSVRNAVSVLSRTQSMVYLEDTMNEPLMSSKGAIAGSSVGLWIDEADYAATSILSESARAGRPKLSQMIDDELGLAEGSIIVGTCGPVKLNVVVRNLVSRNIRPGRILKGDKRGHVAVYSEDFEI